MAEYITTDTELTSVADAIRAKGGTSAALAYPAGFVSAINNIPSGGGGSSYTLLATQEFTVSTTSTTAQSVGIVQAGSAAWTSNKIVYVRIRDKAGARNGHYVGTDTYFCNERPANGISFTYYTAAKMVYRRLDNGTFLTAAVITSDAYGLYGYTITSAGEIDIRVKYSSSYSLTIDGTYVVEVYLLDWPDGISPFE